jgi:lysophospholipase L1-like esterase
MKQFMKTPTTWNSWATSCVPLALVCATLVSARTSAQSSAEPAPPAKARRSGQGQDFAGFRRYRQANARLAAPAPGENRVVFLGDSITDAWSGHDGEFFAGKPYVNRGISGQTTQQMLLRFRPDVIALKPKVVVILAGINDLAGNTGPSTPEEIEGNLTSMAELAHANGIRVVLASILPASRFPWRPELPNPTPTILAMNGWIKDYAAKHGCVYLDYFTAMADSQNGLKDELAEDAVHPNKAGYAIMGPLAEKAIAEALQIK